MLKEPLKAIIRVVDVRSTEKDKVEIYKSYRPGDLVVAQVISLGDSSGYYLSTAKNELGVVFAKNSLSGLQMYPISWEEMKCPSSGNVEPRKCAKPKE